MNTLTIKVDYAKDLGKYSDISFYVAFGAVVDKLTFYGYKDVIHYYHSPWYKYTKEEIKTFYLMACKLASIKPHLKHMEDCTTTID